MLRQALNCVISPEKIIFKLWESLELGSYELRLDYDVFNRPHYAFCLYHAARQAHLLGHKTFSVAEFGVAGGAGLLELERLVEEVEALFPVKIEIYGFDTGEGLPAPVDYRDLPYIWKEGFYKMDQAALKARLQRSKLVLGDVKDTVPGFFEEHGAAPLGAVFLDLDFWSSTADAMRIFDTDPNNILPRTYCYCDDVISSDKGGVLNEYVGQLAAIREYNEALANRKMSKVAGFLSTRIRPAAWNEQIYVHHDFDHPDYNVYVHPDSNRQLAI